MKPKKLEFLAILCFAFMLLIPRFPFETLQPEFTNTIYDDSLAAGWLNWSWATTDLAVSSPVHSGSHSIGVTFGAWQGFFLHIEGRLDLHETDEIDFDYIIGP